LRIPARSKTRAPPNETRAASALDASRRAACTRLHVRRPLRECLRSEQSRAAARRAQHKRAIHGRPGYCNMSATQLFHGVLMGSLRRCPCCSCTLALARGLIRWARGSARLATTLAFAPRWRAPPHPVTSLLLSPRRCHSRFRRRLLLNACALISTYARTDSSAT